MSRNCHIRRVPSFDLSPLPCICNSVQHTLLRLNLFKGLSVPSSVAMMNGIGLCQRFPLPPRTGRLQCIKKRGRKYLDSGFPAMPISRTSGEEARSCLSWRPFAGEVSHALWQAPDQATHQKMSRNASNECVRQPDWLFFCSEAIILRDQRLDRTKTFKIRIDINSTVHVQNLIPQNIRLLSDVSALMKFMVINHRGQIVLRPDTERPSRVMEAPGLAKVKAFGRHLLFGNPDAMQNLRNLHSRSYNAHAISKALFRNSEHPFTVCLHTFV